MSSWSEWDYKRPTLLPRSICFRSLVSVLLFRLNRGLLNAHHLLPGQARATGRQRQTNEVPQQVMRAAIKNTVCTPRVIHRGDVSANPMAGCGLRIASLLWIHRRSPLGSHRKRIDKKHITNTPPQQGLWYFANIAVGIYLALLLHEK